MAGAPTPEGDAQFFIFCRFCPGFLAACPYGEFIGLPEDQLYQAIRRAARTSVIEQLGAQDELKRQQCASRQQHLEAVAAQSQRRRRCGDAVPRKQREIAKKEGKRPKPPTKKQVAAKQKKLAEAIGGFAPEPADFPLAQMPLPAPAPPYLSGLSSRERGLLRLTGKVGWHDGESSTASLRFRGNSPTVVGWHGLWSEKLWIGAVESQPLAAAMAVYCERICNGDGVDDGKWWYPLSHRSGNARFGYLNALQLAEDDIADTLDEISRFGSRVTDCAYEGELQRLAPLFDNRVQAERMKLQITTRVASGVGASSLAGADAIPRTTGKVEAARQPKKRGPKKDPKVTARRELVAAKLKEGLKPGAIAADLDEPVYLIRKDVERIETFLDS